MARIPAPVCPLNALVGLDVAGTLVKLVYFEPTDDDTKEADIVNNIHKYLTSNRTYGQLGIRDVDLQLDAQRINGREGSLHFIRFPTSTMPEFLHLAKSKGLAACASTVCATGGGACKDKSACREELHLELKKFDELESMVSGVNWSRWYLVFNTWSITTGMNVIITTIPWTWTGTFIGRCLIACVDVATRHYNRPIWL